MAIHFPDEINPKHIAEPRNLKLRFEYSYRARQYLDYFGIISYREHTYTPLRLDFEDSNSLNQFLYETGILYDEITVSASFSHLSETITVVDLAKIYPTDVNMSIAMLQHKFYSVNEIAELLSFSRPTVYKIIREGKLKASRINKQLRVKHADYIDYVTAMP